MKLMIDFEAEENLENFFVSAVLSVFAIRTFLFLTGYPQLGNEEVHIAHMLWGGMLMVTALITLLVFLSKEVRHLGSIVAGIGFGVFIDELGKVITSDNNYFFQPAIALIYIIFVFIFLVFRGLEKYVDNMVDKGKIVKEKTVSDNFFFSKTKRNLTKFYLQFVKNNFFAGVLTGLFVSISILNIFFTLVDLIIFKDQLSFWDWGQLVSALFIGMLVVFGIFRQVQGRKLSAYNFYKQAVMIDIFLGQFFLFYREGLSSYLHLVISISILSAIKYLIYQEKLDKH